MSISDKLIKDFKENDIKKEYNKESEDKETEDKETEDNKKMVSKVFDKSKKWINENFIKNVPDIKFAKTDYEKGGILRYNSMSLIKYLDVVDMHKNILVIFKLKSLIFNKEINYGTLFCSYFNDELPSIKRNTNIKQTISNGLILKYINTSSSLISCDGEYKTRLINYIMISNSKISYPELWDELESYINSIIIKRKWSIYPVYYEYEIKKYDINDNLENAIKNTSLAKSLLIIMWFHTICNELLNITETHINENVKDIILFYKDEDIYFIKKLIKKYGSDLIEKFRISISINIFETYGKKRYYQLGFKMIPLNVKEVQDPLRLRYKPWREILIANKCNDLVANQISPGFSILADWIYVRNTNKNLYDNKSQYEKIKHSELARDIIRSLYEAQRGTYLITSGMLNNDVNNRVKQWLNSKFKKLSDKIDDPIKYSIEELVMSDITLLYISEFVGKTYADIIEISSRSSEYIELLGDPFNDYTIFAKYIFELCYNLLVINKKLGIIHGDLHLNNATIGYLYDVADINKVVYEIDDIYVFPNNGYFSCLIDFSRSIINPDKADSLADLSIPTSFKPVKNYEKFANGEINLLLNLYILLFPNKEKQREELIVLCKNHYNEVFKLLSCIDIYMFTLRLIKYLQQKETKINKKCMELLERINRLAESFIATDMNHLLNDTANYVEKVSKMDWPISQIIKKCFTEFVNGNTYKNIGIVTDAYSIKNDIIKSISKYDLFPDFIRELKYYEGDKLVNFNYITETRKTKRYEYEKKRIENLDYIKDIAFKYTTFIDE
jgi:hypothetical protein